MNIKYIAVLVFGLFFAMQSCSNKSDNNKIADDEIVARVADRTITARDFKMSYQYSAHIPSDKKGFEAKKEQLNRVVQRKLFAAEAEQRGFVDDPKLKHYQEWYRKKAAIKEMYRREIESKVRISEEELREAFVKSKTKIRARHLYARSPEGAEELLERLRQGETFEELAQQVFRDSTLANNGGDLGYFTWGDMDENIEKAAYSLKPGEISTPVRSQYGWHIIQVIDKKQEAMLTEQDFRIRKHDLERTLRRRKSSALATQFVKKVMEPRNVVLKGKAFSIVARAFERAFGDNQDLLPPFTPNVFTQELNQISGKLQTYRDMPLLTFKDGHWTIGEFITKMERIPVTDRPVYKNPKKLSQDIGILYRDEVLAKMALNRGLDDKPRSRREWKNRWDDALYSKMVSQIVDTIQVTDEDVESYYHNHPDEFVDPSRVNIREIFVRSSSLAEKLLKRIKNGEDMGQLAKQYTERSWAAKRNGEFGYFVEGAHGKIGELAFEHKLGELIGPIKIAGGPPRGGYSIFRVLGKKEGGKIPLSATKTELRQKLLMQRREKAITKLTSELKQEMKVTMNLEKIRDIKTLDDYGGRPMVFFPIRNF